MDGVSLLFQGSSFVRNCTTERSTGGCVLILLVSREGRAIGMKVGSG